ncbi:MAG: hypothetical protein ACOH2D_11560 [Gelidibacter sp.]
MNRIDFDQVGGYRLETQTFSEMQKNYNLLQSLGSVLGNRAIVQGCVVSGSTVTDGVIYWDGELIEFKGGNVQTTIVIVQTTESILFLDGNQKPTFYRRHATFGTGVNSVAWADFKRIFPLSSALFLNEVRMYAGAINSIPAGWKLCDGIDGRPNLKGRFVVGYDADVADYNAIGKTGGAKEVSLSIPQLPSHSFHTVGGAYVDDGTNTQVNSSNTVKVSGDRQGDYHRYNLHGTNAQADKGKTNTLGSGEAHENRPPYYTLAYIIFTGN